MFTLICVYLFVETDQIGGGCTEENEGHLHVVRTKANSLQSESVNANVSSDERERESSSVPYPQVSFSQKPPSEAHTDPLCHLDL